MKSLLVFTEVYNPGGGNRYMTDLINGIAENYEEIHISSNRGGLYAEDAERLNRSVVFHSSGFVTRALLGNYIRAWPLSIRNLILFPLVSLEPLFFVFNVVLFSRLLLRLQPSRVLSCNGGYPAAAACLAMVVAARLAHIPVALSVVSMPAKRRAFLWLYEKSIDLLVWRAVTLVIVNAQVIADALCAGRDMPEQKVVVVYNGLEDKAHTKFASSAVGRDPFVIGCIARMDFAKGAVILLDAFATLAERWPKLRLVLAGHGDASANLVRRIKSLGLQDRVEMLGYYDGDVHTLLGTFDLYVFPSLWEGFPYSIVEAMRAGVPIVSTRVGGIPEAITDGVEGLLVESGSSEAIVRALERLLNDPALLLTIGCNARVKYEKSLSLDKMHSRIRDVFTANWF